MRESYTRGTLGIFPALQSFGGVQASGREARGAIISRIGKDRARFLDYESGSWRGGAVLRALGNRRAADVILVWHIDLLKLVPFLNSRGSRAVLFLHGIEAWRQQDPLTNWALNRVNLFLTNSDYTWERFLQFGERFRSVPHRTIPLGLGTRLVTPASTPSSKPIALMVGRIHKSEEYKGHREMLEAWPLVLQTIPDAELWIAGDGSLRNEIEQQARARELNGQVRFWGQISDVEKEKLIEQCRCLAMPSRGEGFGLVYLEAMRMGRPCLVSNHDAGREVVNPPETGLAADPADPRQVADAVIRLLQPGPEWNRWSEQARQRYESRFTAEQFRHRLNSALFPN